MTPASSTGGIPVLSGGRAFRKTRIAPTPSGFLHLGNALSFALTAALARATGARILLRIDDMDRDRADPKYVRDIFDTLHYLEIPWDEGPRDSPEFEREYSQIHRLDGYRKALEELQHSGKLYACSCSRAEIARHSPDGSYPGTCKDKGIPFTTADCCWRLRTDPGAEVVVKELGGGVEGLQGPGGLLKGQLPGEMQDFVVRKRDGFPAYQLTSVLDDLFFGVDLVVRGKDLWPSTLAQIYFAREWGLQGELAGEWLPQEGWAPTFHHHALLPDASGEKLSKSAGATSIQFLRKEGHSREDIYSMIAGMLGIKSRVRNFEELALSYL